VYGATCVSHVGFRCVRRPYPEPSMIIHLKSLFMPHQCHARGGWNRLCAGQWQWPYGLTVIQSADSRAGLAERKGNDGSRLRSCLISFLIHSWSCSTMPIHALGNICFGCFVSCFGYIAWNGFTFAALWEYALVTPYCLSTPVMLASPCEPCF
jgi:hypothetical protein